MTYKCINDSTSRIAANFLEVAESFNFCQHVSGPTHVRGNTLDLVFTLGLMIDSVASEELPVTDHDCILLILTAQAASASSIHEC